MSNPRVLVLDDDPGIRDLLHGLLFQSGYRTVAAANLEEALAVLDEGDVHALVLDVRLEGTASGLDLLTVARSRAELARAPVLVATGRALSQPEEALITRHGAFLFYKPEGFRTMVRFLDTLIGRDQSH